MDGVRLARLKGKRQAGEAPFSSLSREKQFCGFSV
jgi:hypothetical protein